MYIKKLDFELSSLIFYVFMYVVSCRDAEFTFPGLIGERVDKLTLDAVLNFGGSSSNIEPGSQCTAMPATSCRACLWLETRCDAN